MRPPAAAGKGMPVREYRPTLAEMEDFDAYIARIERECADTGAALIRPPASWRPRADTTYADIDGMQLTNPIRQEAMGSRTARGSFLTLHIERSRRSVGAFRREAADFHARTRAPVMTDKADESVDRAFWKNALFRRPLYGADQDASLFDDDCPSFNLRALDTILTAGAGQGIPGVTRPYLYFGMWGALFAFHCEDADLYGINYLHLGAPKTWYTIPLAFRAKFEKVCREAFPDHFRSCDQFLRHKQMLLSPEFLTRHGIPFGRAVQTEGAFCVVFPGVYHAGFNHGFNVAEAVNFASLRWLPRGRKAGKCECREDSVNLDVEAIFRKVFPGSATEEFREYVEMNVRKAVRLREGLMREKGVVVPVKRKRGRPRKHPIKDTAAKDNVVGKVEVKDVTVDGLMQTPPEAVGMLKNEDVTDDGLSPARDEVMLKNEDAMNDGVSPTRVSAMAVVKTEPVPGMLLKSEAVPSVVSPTGTETLVEKTKTGHYGDSIPKSVVFPTTPVAETTGKEAKGNTIFNFPHKPRRVPTGETGVQLQSYLQPYRPATLQPSTLLPLQGSFPRNNSCATTITAEASQFGIPATRGSVSPWERKTPGNYPVTFALNFSDANRQRADCQGGGVDEIASGSRETGAARENAENRVDSDLGDCTISTPNQRAVDDHKPSPEMTGTASNAIEILKRGPIQAPNPKSRYFFGQASSNILQAASGENSHIRFGFCPTALRDTQARPGSCTHRGTAERTDTGVPVGGTTAPGGRAGTEAGTIAEGQARTQDPRTGTIPLAMQLAHPHARPHHLLQPPHASHPGPHAPVTPAHHPEPGVHFDPPKRQRTPLSATDSAPGPMSPVTDYASPSPGGGAGIKRPSPGAASLPASEEPRPKKRRNWAPIAVVPMKKVSLPPGLEGDELEAAEENYRGMCAVEQQVFMVSTLLSLVKFVLRGQADLKKVAALGRRLSKTRKRFLNVQRGMFDVYHEMAPAADGEEGAGIEGTETSSVQPGLVEGAEAVMENAVIATSEPDVDVGSPHAPDSRILMESRILTASPHAPESRILTASPHAPESRILTASPPPTDTDSHAISFGQTGPTAESNWLTLHPLDSEPELLPKMPVYPASGFSPVTPAAAGPARVHDFGAHPPPPVSFPRGGVVTPLGAGSSPWDANSFSSAVTHSLPSNPMPSASASAVADNPIGALLRFMPPHGVPSPDVPTPGVPSPNMPPVEGAPHAAENLASPFNAPMHNLALASTSFPQLAGPAFDQNHHHHPHPTLRGMGAGMGSGMLNATPEMLAPLPASLAQGLDKHEFAFAPWQAQHAGRPRGAGIADHAGGLGNHSLVNHGLGNQGLIPFDATHGGQSVHVSFLEQQAAFEPNEDTLRIQQASADPFGGPGLFGMAAAEPRTGERDPVPDIAGLGHPGAGAWGKG